jgi:HEAT repeat protein
MRDDKYGTADEIMALDSPRLIEILRDPGASTFAKAKACQRLAVVGHMAAVPALAALLTDPRLSHYARFGLEPIPNPSVDAALRGALEKVQGKLLVGVINSIGVRRDPEAIPELGKLLTSSDSEVAQAAAAALARIRPFF